MPSSLTPEAQQPVDMAAERQRSTVSHSSLSILLAGSSTQRARQAWLASLLSSNPVFDKTHRPFQSRTQRFLHGQKIALAYFELRNRYGLPKEDRDLLRLYLDEYITLQVHESMAAETIARQGDERQWREWGPAVKSGRWLLCYAQTELAHGSNLSALRTTATLDKATDEWIIHTPEPSAGKVWIGGSGSSATHAILMAQLIIEGSNKGMHPLLVPLRDPDTHRLLPGRKAMDMGPKVGAPAMDNGYLVFTHVRIPRENLLQRFQTVDKDGKYELRNAQAKPLTRASMTLVRVGLCEIAAYHAARASVIATRYAVVRRQGSSRATGLALDLPPGSNSGEPSEPKIIDYASVQMRLLSGLATSYVLTLAGHHTRDIYNTLQSELREKGNSELLPVVHGYTSILKATVTNAGLSVVETARRSMGGHGYSAASGLTELERSQPTANLTYEGDNNMLLATVGPKFLLQQLEKARNSGKATRMELQFLVDAAPGKASWKGRGKVSVEEFSQPSTQLSLLSHRASRLVHSLSSLTSNKSLSPSLSAHLYTSLGVRASEAFSDHYLLQAYHKRLSLASSTLDQPTLSALRHLATIFAAQCVILPHLSDFVEQPAEGGGEALLDASDVENLRRANALAMLGVRPDVVGLGDAFEFTDAYLGSALGSYDGKAYDRMLHFMSLEPLNRSTSLDASNGGRDSEGVLVDFRKNLGRLTHGEVEPWNEEEARRREEEREAERRERSSKL